MCRKAKTKGEIESVTPDGVLNTSQFVVLRVL